MNLLDILMGAKDRPGVAELLKQYIRDAMPGGSLNPEVSGQGLLDSAAVATTPAPLLGDVVGLAADANRYVNEPEERTPGNFAMSALGLLPFVPAMSTVKAGKEWVPKARDKKVNKSDSVLIGTKGFAAGPNQKGGLSPQKWRSMENRYQQQVERGAPLSRYWYDDASKRLFDLTGQDVPRSDRLANVVGETSAGTPVDANTGHGIKG